MKKYINNDINNKLLLEIVNKLNDSPLYIKKFLTSTHERLSKSIVHKCLNYLLLLEKLCENKQLHNELITEIYSNGYEVTMREQIVMHIEDVIDNIRDRIRYNYDFYYTIFSNSQYKQTRKYMFICMISVMNEPEFYSESEQEKCEAPVLYWDNFKFIFDAIIQSEEFLKLFINSMYEIKDKEQHMKLLNELLNNVKLLSGSWFDPVESFRELFTNKLEDLGTSDDIYSELNVKKPPTKEQVISILQGEIQNYQKIIDNSI